MNYTLKYMLESDKSDTSNCHYRQSTEGESSSYEHIFITGM